MIFKLKINKIWTKNLLKYLNTDSPSTFEVEAQKEWIKEVSKYATSVKTDNFGNTVAYYKSLNKQESTYKVVIDAMWYECSYRTGFDPSEKNIREREILSDFSNIAAEKIKYLKEQSCEL